MTSSEVIHIGIGGMPTACFDEHVYTGPKARKRFSWDRWAKKTFDLMNGKPSERAVLNGRPVIKASFEPCSIVDGMVESWRQDFQSAVSEIEDEPSSKGLSSFRTVADKLLAVETKDHADIRNAAYQALRAGAESAIGLGRWNVAVALAEATGEYSNAPEIQDLIDEAKLGKKKHTAKLRSEWKTSTQELRRIQGLKWRQHRIREIVITDVSVIAEPVTVDMWYGVRGSHTIEREEIWFGDIKRITEMGKVGFLPIALFCKKDHIKIFGPGDRDPGRKAYDERIKPELAQTLHDALNAWRKKYADAL